MSSGIRATVTISSPETCPIARCSADADASIDQVSRSAVGPDGNGGVSEFLTDADELADEAVSGPIFSYGTANVYRVSHDGDDPCPCERLGAFGCPVHRYVADGGDVTLVFHAPDFEQLQVVMDDLRERYPDLDVQQLLQPPLEGTTEERVFVNRGKLTDRQHEVLRTAYEMGYFERPKGANATEIASELDITQSTVTEHLVAAQQKLLGDVLDAPEQRD